MSSNDRIADKDYFLEADGETVTTDEKKAAFLFKRKGQEFSNEELEKLAAATKGGSKEKKAVHPTENKSTSDKK